jgi:hypothetical protein
MPLSSRLSIGQADKGECMNWYHRPSMRPTIIYHNATDMKAYPEDLKTEKQWKKLGYKPKENAEEFKLWQNPHHHMLCSYYLREDIEPIKQ